MVWDPTHPGTSGAVVSAPLRDNFAALDTQLMAPVIAAAPEQVLKVGASDTLAGIPAGSNGQVLTLVAGAPTWTAPAFTNPMTSVGDLVTGATAGAPQRLAIGTTGHVLTAAGGVPAWQALPVDPGFANPMNQIGDLITGATAGAATRLAAVATGAVLASAGVGTTPTWNATPTLTSVTVTATTGMTLSSTGLAAINFQPGGGHLFNLYAINATHAFVLQDQTDSKTLMSFTSTGDPWLNMSDGAAQTLRGPIQVGPTSSGGAGYRYLRVPN